jgi:hypothetical protein
VAKLVTIQSPLVLVNLAVQLLMDQLWTPTVLPALIGQAELQQPHSNALQEPQATSEPSLVTVLPSPVTQLVTEVNMTAQLVGHLL